MRSYEVKLQAENLFLEYDDTLSRIDFIFPGIYVIPDPGYNFSKEKLPNINILVNIKQ
jgi:hypothetical protein